VKGRIHLWVLLLITSLVVGGACGPIASEDRVDVLLKKAPLIDGHIDLLIHYVARDGKSFAPLMSYDIAQRTSGQVDLPRLRAGKVGAAIFTVAILNQEDREAGIRESTDLFRSLAAHHPRDLEVVTDSVGLMRAFAGGRIAVLFGLEGGDQIGTSLDVLCVMHRYGVRAMTLVWEKTNEIGDSNADAPRHDGLSEFGVEVVRTMNGLGMLVDVSHAAESTVLDVLAVSRAPVVLSHSSARALCPSSRNVSDDVLRRISANDGIVMVSFVPYFTAPEYWSWYERGEARWAELRHLHGEDKAAVSKSMELWDAQNPQPIVTVSDVADHIDHVRRMTGVDHVGLGSDFDGMGSFTIKGLEDASTYPALFQELVRRGWTDTDLGKLAGGNFLRVLQDVQAAALPNSSKTAQPTVAADEPPARR
jgi:membrane dipeptidase